MRGEVLTEEGVRACLPEGGRVRRVVCLETVDSTNTYAKALALEGAEAGTLVIANHQTAGRGRRGRSFLSPPGTGLYMTLILRPSADLERFQMVTVAAAVAVCLALEALTPLRPLVKWVNDVFLRDEAGRERKVCGILTEAVTGAGGGEIESVVVGIGINVLARDFGEELEGVAGALFDRVDGPRTGRCQLAAAVAERLMDLAGRLDDPELIRLYRERSLLLGRRVRWTQDGEVRFGRAADIDDRGSLLVEPEGGPGRVALRSGEVFEVRPADLTSP